MAGYSPEQLRRKQWIEEKGSAAGYMQHYFPEKVKAYKDKLNESKNNNGKS